jgi:A/G-specific adenine glycosylase
MRGKRARETRGECDGRAIEPGSGERAADDEPDRDEAWVGSVRERLLAWAEVSGRELPWRSEPDPYRVLVSEMMLVQTTVAAVMPYYERFLRRFPDVGALAEAEEADVLKAWEGLGYYRRARQLHAAAKTIVEAHGGAMPRDPARVRALPGVGRYMAGAILSFAFDLPEPIVEANTQRVLARLLAWRGELKASATQARLWQAAGRLVPSQGAGAFNQAFMDLGAVVCTPRTPSCLLCPLSALCGARKLGLQDQLPVIASKPPPLAVSEACALVVREGLLLTVRRKAEGLWAGFWEFPTIHLEGADPAGRSFGEPVGLAEGIERLTGIRAKIGPMVRTLTYSVTRHRVELRVHRAEGLSGRPRPGPGLVEVRWVAPSDLSTLTFGSAARRLIQWLDQDPERRPLSQGPPGPDSQPP